MSPEIFAEELKHFRKAIAVKIGELLQIPVLEL
jgi:hypothetical protein